MPPSGYKKPFLQPRPLITFIKKNLNLWSKRKQKANRTTQSKSGPFGFEWSKMTDCPFQTDLGKVIILQVLQSVGSAN